MTALTRTRDPHTGQYAHQGDLDRMCVCGHTLGVHVHGGFDCVNVDVGDRTPCDCEKFRQSRAKRHRRPTPGEDSEFAKPGE